MIKILHIKSSARSIEDGSFSRLYGQKLLQKLYEKYHNENIVVKDRDLMIQKPGFMNAIYCNFYISEFKNKPNLNDMNNHYRSFEFDVIKESNEIIDEFKWADEIILECPMYNFSVPGNIKVFLDLLIIINKTFTSDYKGLILNKKIYFICSRGGYGYESDKKHLNLQTPLLDVSFGFIGFEKKNMHFLFIDKTGSDKPDTSQADNFLSNL